MWSVVSLRSVGLNQPLQDRVLITVPALPFSGYNDSILGHYRRYTRQELLGQFVPYLEFNTCANHEPASART